MPEFVPHSKQIAGWLAVMLLAALPAAGSPQRVVSMNLCTDQTAMLLAAPGQLVSVSSLSQDPRMSPMAQTATGYRANHGRAEEIYLLQPDLVIAGEYNSVAATRMLQRLGVRVETFPPAESFDEIRAEIARMGKLLGRQKAASDLLAKFNRGLAQVSKGSSRGRAALYYANGFTSGRDTLAGEIVDAAGYDNIAGDYGISDTSGLPLELLVLAGPDMLITGAKSPGQSRGEAVLDHPALDLSAAVVRQTNSDWICGTPTILRAIGSLQ